MNPRSLHAAAQKMRGMTTKQIDAALEKAGIVDVTDRLTIKHSLLAAGELATDQSEIRLGSLATDLSGRPGQGGLAPSLPSPISEAQKRLLARAGISVTSRQSVSMVDMLLRPLNLDPQTRIELKCAMAEAGLLLPDQASPVTPTRKTMKAEDVAEKPAKRTFTLDEFNQLADSLDLDAMTRTLLKAKLLAAGRLTTGNKTSDLDLQAGGKAGRGCRYTLQCSTNDFDALRR